MCPFCPFTWTRLCKIKARLISDHLEIFTAEMLQRIKTLYGRRVIEFVDAYDYHIPDVEATMRLLAQILLSPSQL